VAAERWSRIRDIFEAVLDAPAAERQALLATLCDGDADLLREVASLLEASDDAGDTLNVVIAFAADDVSVATTSRTAPEQIGPYRILQLLGRGGMGTVYLAERADGAFQHKVALKLLRAGLDSPGAEARFRAERQILADLRHPNIARLVDGGAVEDGSPYLVMEYVEGRPIDHWCDDQRLDLTRRIELFRVVCSAVQAAHRSLVVHRDLKPANILVTADGHPKLLDFGIAKLMAPGGTDHTVALTLTSQRLLTPGYAGPEQVMGRPVTTASDVYSLGVILYELLTGRPPLDFTGLSLREVEQTVEAIDPVRPSLAVRALVDADDGAETAARRGTTPDRLARHLAGDLDTIIMTALRKEPERRYPSVEALSEDLRRFLVQLPIAARPDTVGYRAGRFVRRHRVAVTATGVAAAMVVAFGVQATISARRAVVERDRALAAEERSRVEAATADRVAIFLVDLFRTADPEEARGRDLTVRQVLDRGADRIDRDLAEESEVRARMLLALGTVFANLGEFNRADELTAEAVHILQAADVPGERRAAALNAQSEIRADLGDPAGARRAAERALEAAGAGATPEAARALSQLAFLAYEETHLDEADELVRRSLTLQRELHGPAHPAIAESLFRLGTIQLERNHIDEAVRLHEEAWAMRRKLLGEDHPDTLSGVGVLLASLEAKKEYRRGLERVDDTLPVAIRVLGRDHPDVAYLHVMRGRQLRFLGQWDQAESAFAEALRIERATRGEDHPYAGYALIQLGTVRVAGGDLDGAESAYREALRIYRLAYPEGDRNAANILGKLATIELERGRGPEALDLAQRSRVEFGRLLPEDHTELLEGDLLIGQALVASGRTDEAHRLLQDLQPKVVAVAGDDSKPAREIRQLLDGIDDRMGSR
jgi:serine/threonine protein kinase/tetratricopeptide (TPR) repeat protein